MEEWKDREKTKKEFKKEDKKKKKKTNYVEEGVRKREKGRKTDSERGKKLR